jgi:hypothetical protein
VLNLAILRGEREGFFAEDHPWLIYRYGIPGEARFTISYSPILDVSAPNGIGGVLVTAFETTDRVREEGAARLQATDRKSSNAPANVIASGRCSRICLALRTTTAIPQHQPRVDNLLGWTGTKSSLSTAASSRRCGSSHRRARATGTRRANRTRREPFPSP